jgi:microcin C transport system permease protein
MLSLLIFIGEAVRDALDPRKLFAGEPAPAEEAAAAQPGPAPKSGMEGAER